MSEFRFREFLVCRFKQETLNKVKAKPIVIKL